ncbi:hypothetical protein F1Z41_04650 [Clostridium perfringens]|nr:hypothetical protein [Clostridium perfringens]
MVIESIYASVLDYKSLIDSNWHYLYCPKDEWAKFCKINIFFMFSKRIHIKRNLKNQKKLKRMDIIMIYENILMKIK